MWNAFKKEGRLKAALRYKGLDPDNLRISDLLDVIAKRCTDQELNPLVWRLIGFLEPASCQMTHCEHFGNSPAFCNCVLKKIPGKCGINRKFKKRQAEREKKKVPFLIWGSGGLESIKGHRAGSCRKAVFHVHERVEGFVRFQTGQPALCGDRMDRRD